eukprot:7264198-Pyramimonas_sp.AAC.1
MRRGGRFLATPPLGKRYTTGWVYYMLGSDARLQGGHLLVLVCLCASHVPSCYDVPTYFSFDHLKESRAPGKYRNWSAFTCRALGGDTRSTLLRYFPGCSE